MKISNKDFLQVFEIVYKKKKKADLPQIQKKCSVVAEGHTGLSYWS